MSSGAVTGTDRSSSEIVDAIVGSLEELTFDITGNPVGCDPLDISFDPAVHEDVAGGSSVMFEETIAVPADTAAGVYSCTAEFRADDTVIGTQQVTITVERGIEVPVDVKPGSCPDPLNQQSRGDLPVAIVSTGDFDASEVDPASVTLAGVSPIGSSLEDAATPYEPFTGKTERDDCTTARGDGLTDLVLHFDAQSVLAAIGPVPSGEVHVLELTGTLTDGTDVAGEDVVWIR